MRYRLWESRSTIIAIYYNILIIDDYFFKHIPSKKIQIVLYVNNFKSHRPNYLPTTVDHEQQQEQGK